MTQRSDRAVGITHALFAYGIWGILPIYLWFTRPTGTVELIAWRVLLSVVFCAAVLHITRRWSRFTSLLRERRTVLLLALAGVLVLGNWLLYVWSVELNKPLEGALGYYLNPLMSMLFGMLVFGERLRPLQVLALVLAVAAVVVLIVGYGSPPWLSLSISITFALYGVVKKAISGRVDPVAGFMVETVMVTPVAVVLLVLVIAQGSLTFGTISPGHTVVLLFAGVITSLPLVLFASASAKLPLIEIGFFQFLAPTLQFIAGLVLFREHMPVERWIAFAIVWVALTVFVIDMVRNLRASRNLVVPTPGA